VTPATKLRGLSLFVTGDYEAFDKRITKFEPGYSSDRWGGTLGADYSFTDWAVAGIAFSYAHVDGTFRRSRGGFETDSYGPLLYAGLVPAQNFFVDVVAGYTRKESTIERDVDFAGSTGNGFLERHGTALGDPGANQYIVGVNTGYDFVIRNLTIGPRVGVNYKLTTVDAFAERRRDAISCLSGVCAPRISTGLELAYDRQEETSLTTVAGIFASLAISTGFGVLIPQGTFESMCTSSKTTNGRSAFTSSTICNATGSGSTTIPRIVTISTRAPDSFWCFRADFRRSSTIERSSDTRTSRVTRSRSDCGSHSDRAAATTKHPERSG
jgi:hypothetical protein